MHRLPQAGSITFYFLLKNSVPYRYDANKFIADLWYQKSEPINSILTVNGFGVKHINKWYAYHPKTSLEAQHSVPTY